MHLAQDLFKLLYLHSLPALYFRDCAEETEDGGEKFISSNPSHQNCTTQSMRYGLIIFIATTTDLLYLN
jgi:hypothetical protein